MGLGKGRRVWEKGKSTMSWTILWRETFLARILTPLPGSAKPGDSPSIISKGDIDGLFYTLTPLKPPGGEGESIWTHTSTFSPLSFVLASKQGVRYTHVSDRLVLAFESGLRGLGFNIYLYEATPTHSAEWAKQSVIRVGDAATSPSSGWEL